MTDFSDSLAHPSLVDRRDEMPLGALGLALSDPTSSLTDEKIRSALERRICYPDNGIDYAALRPLTGHLNTLNDTMNRYSLGSLLGAPNPKHSRLSLLRQVSQVARSVPVILLSVAAAIWVFEEHVADFLTKVTTDTTGKVVLPPFDPDFTFGPPPPIPYKRPKARGRVTPAHLEAFTARIPRLYEVLHRLIQWDLVDGAASAPAAFANADVSSALGIEVDVRIGGLVPEDGVEDAVGLAAGGVVHPDGRSQYLRLAKYVAARIPAAGGIAGKLGVRGVERAVWSCMLDHVLNHTEAWDQGIGEQGTHIWASDCYVSGTPFVLRADRADPRKGDRTYH